MKNIVFFLLCFCAFGCATTKNTETNYKIQENNTRIEEIYIKVQNKVKKPNNVKTKFYNFDDLLINGQYKKPQVLYTDAKQKVKFERLLKLKKDFLPDLENSAKDPVLR